MVPATGLEPVRCYSLEPESSASANSATRASLITNDLQQTHFPQLLLCIPSLYPVTFACESDTRYFAKRPEARGTLVQRWQVALISASAASAAIRQQRELLWQNQTERQDHS